MKPTLSKITCLILFLCLLLPAGHAQEYDFSSEEKIFLRKIQKKALDYFLKEANPSTGLIHDSAPNHAGPENNSPASIAASGFALSAYAVGAENKWISRNEALNRVKRALRFAVNRMETQNGFFYHFISMETGKRVSQSEVSPIDTAIFTAGALFASAYFDDPEVTALAQKLYERIDFPWMLNGGKFFALSWSPEKKFDDKLWDHFDESLLLYVLGIGSPTHPIDAQVWHALRRPIGSYQSQKLVAMPPLFTHQYPHIWIDFRDKQDGFINYFRHSVTACEISRAFAIDQSEVYRTYGPNAWGLTASDGPHGYKAYGSPPGWAQHDGTLAPTGCGGCMPFTPKESLACLRHFYTQFGSKMDGRYGLADAINEDEDWVSSKVLAIDQGTMMLMIENALTGLLWKKTNTLPAVQKAFDKIGFKPGEKDLLWLQPPQIKAMYVAGGIQADGYLKDWPGGGAVMTLDQSNAEFGEFKKNHDGRAKFRFAWDETALYFAAEVEDDSLVAKQAGQNIWRDDLIEIFVDPDGDGLFWEDERDFQIGFRPARESGGTAAWSWFQRGEDPIQSGWVQAASFSDGRGYILEGSIRWDAVKTFPRPGMKVDLSPALHDVDMDKTHRKLHWFFRSERDFKRFQLGHIILEEPHAKKTSSKS